MTITGRVHDDELEGTWLLESFVFTDADGGVYRPLGDAPAGALTFTGDGYVTFSFMDPERPDFAADDLFAGADGELAKAAAGYVSFGGPFRVNGDAIEIEVTYSLFPNWVGRRQTRLFEVAGDRLTLRTPVAMLFNGRERRAEARLRRAVRGPEQRS